MLFKHSIYQWMSLTPKDKFHHGLTSSNLCTRWPLVQRDSQLNDMFTFRAGCQLALTAPLLWHIVLPLCSIKCYNSARGGNHTRFRMPPICFVRIYLFILGTNSAGTYGWINKAQMSIHSDHQPLSHPLVRCVFNYFRLALLYFNYPDTTPSSSSRSES